MKISKSSRLFKKAKKFIPGGVNSPVRGFGNVGGNPLFIRKGKGAHIWDEDGNKFIDYVGSWGPMILGHADPRVLKAIRESAERGTNFGAPTEIEVRMAELITKMMPSVESVRMVNSGTEATMSAVRLARAYTGRAKIIKFEGCYHGHADTFLIRAGSGATTLGIPDSPGVTKSTSLETLNAKFNDIESVKKLVDTFKTDIAAIIVEPIAGNMGCIPPKPGFLNELQAVCLKEKIVFILDEIMTGFRVAPGGAQELYHVRPDLTTLGKIIGGGLPVGAYGGKKEIMNLIAPSGPVYQAGTLSGNPIAMAAGYETLSILSNDRYIYGNIEKQARELERGMHENLRKVGLGYRLNRVGSMFTLFFTEGEVADYDSAKNSDTKMFASYFRKMLERGIYLPPSQFETAFISSGHSGHEIEQTLNAQRLALKKMVI